MAPVPLTALIGVRGSRLPPELCVAVTAGVIVAGLSHGRDPVGGE